MIELILPTLIQVPVSKNTKAYNANIRYDKLLFLYTHWGPTEYNDSRYATRIV